MAYLCLFGCSMIGEKYNPDCCWLADCCWLHERVAVHMWSTTTITRQVGLKTNANNAWTKFYHARFGAQDSGM